MKKILSLLLCFTMVILCLSGCDSSKTNNSLSQNSEIDFGFYNLDKCNKFLAIDGYNPSQNIVFASTYYSIWEFMEKYIQVTSISFRTGKSSTRKEMYYIQSKDTIVDSDNTSLTIIDIVVLDKKENYFILKGLTSSGQEQWFITYDAIDWSEELVEDKENKCLNFSLK